MTLNSSHADQVTLRREHTARLRLRGLSQREIVVALANVKVPGTDIPLLQPVSVATVNRDLKILTAEWRLRAAEDIDTRKARQLAEIDEARRRAWADGDLANLARFIKLESDIFGTMASVKVDVRTWQDRVIDLLKAQKVTPAEVVEKFGRATAEQLFALAGVMVSETVEADADAA